MRLAFIGTESNHVISGLDFIWHVVRRCCESDAQVIVSEAQIEQLTEKLLQLVWIKDAPIKLPESKKIGLRESLWKCWTLLLVLSARVRNRLFALFELINHNSNSLI